MLYKYTISVLQIYNKCYTNIQLVLYKHIINVIQIYNKCYTNMQ